MEGIDQKERKYIPVYKPIRGREPPRQLDLDLERSLGGFMERNIELDSDCLGVPDIIITMVYIKLYHSI